MKLLSAAVCFIYLLNPVAGQQAEYAPDQLIVRFKSASDIRQWQANEAKFRRLNADYEVLGFQATGNKKEGLTYLLEFSSAPDLNRVIEAFMATGSVEYAEPNYIGYGGGKQFTPPITPNDAFFGRQYGLHNNGSFDLAVAKPDADVDMIEAWDIETGSSDLIVAVLDSGVKLNHPELNGRIWTNPTETSNGSDEDNNGYVDDLLGWDFANSDNDPTDDHGHGTNVAGIIGANADNGIGYAGVDWHCQIMVCKILNESNFGFYSWWAEAIYYAVDNGAKVINMSVGGNSPSNTLKVAADYAYDHGVTIVACMMNTDNNITYFPAGYQTTIAVGSTNPNDERSTPFFWDANSGSNYGAHIDVVAPGNFIYGLSHNSNTNYGTYWGGTSQATPLVAGLCALLLAQDGDRTPADLRRILRNTAEDQVGRPSEDKAGFDEYYGYGRVNAFAALTEELAAVDADINTKPSYRIWPNPATTQIKMSSTLVISRINLINELGQIVKTGDLAADHLSALLDVGELPSGIYTAVIHRQEGRVDVERILIQ